MSQMIRLIDSARTLLAVGHVEQSGPHFAGTIEPAAMPLALRRKFEEFEELVNGQVFSLTDQIEEEIAALPLSVVFEDGVEGSVEDLQIFPKAGTISFKLNQEAVASAPR
ncbi:MAG: hypothetical protein P4L84_09010 [Isosphaeraceae bacterium]|nr:hypothetical protein [Isosphaeraceae bacterium]